jgi:hypothetical protein
MMLMSAGFVYFLAGLLWLKIDASKTVVPAPDMPEALPATL